MEPHVASSMIVALRLAGHLPHTIMKDFQVDNAHTILDYLKSHLDLHKTSPHLRPGHIASIFQAVSALCYDPQNFFSHNIKDALLNVLPSFQHSTCRNSFEYSSVALGVCQSLGTNIEPLLVREIQVEINQGCTTKTCMKQPDTTAMAIIALSCLRRNIAGRDVDVLVEVEKTIKRFLQVVNNALHKCKDLSWNAQSKGLLVQVKLVWRFFSREQETACDWLVMSSVASQVLQSFLPRYSI
jgi:hypothetical protein